MWERLGHKPAIATAGWPVVDPALLVDDEVEAVIQINGKIVDRMKVSPSITDAEFEAAALALAFGCSGDCWGQPEESDCKGTKACQHRSVINSYTRFTIFLLRSRPPSADGKSIS